MSMNYILARDKFKPDDGLKFLLIVESPPASGGYFYFERATSKGGLFSETMKALGLFPEGSGVPKGFDKRPLLRQFQSQGFFVVDVSYEPVNSLPNHERKRVIMDEIPKLIGEVRKLDPQSIIIIKASIFEVVKEALEKAGFGKRILNHEALPFPSHGHQKIYRQKLRGLISAK
jgi:hypothetical protein